MSNPADRPARPPSVTSGDADPEGRLRRGPIQVRPSPIAGRGVFATRPIAQGALIEEAPVLLIDADVPALDDYILKWDDAIDDDRELVLPLGYGAIYNHGVTPNAYWETDRVNLLMIIWAARDIAADEEILISYGSRWFPERGLTPIP